MEFNAEAIAQFLSGRVEGDAGVLVNTFSKIEEGQAGSLSFLANSKYESFLYTCNSSIVLVNNDFKPREEVKATLIYVENAYESLATLLELYEQSVAKPSGVMQPSAVHEDVKVGEAPYIGEFAVVQKGAKIGDNVMIYPQVFIGEGVTIGDNVTLYSGVKIYKGCVVGDNCIIHSGTVIGSDGFGFAPTNEEYKKIPQIGNVVIEADVELGANCAIDRATMGSTIIRKGTKLDNLVQVAHNVEIGESTVIAAQTGIAGTAKVGSRCMFGGQVGIAGHLTIADGTMIGAQSGIANSVKKPGQMLMGTPAFDMSLFRRSSILVKQLPEMNKRITELEHKLKK